MLVAGGSTDVTTYFAMRKTSDGTAATGLTPADFDLQYVRTREVPVAKVDASALGAANSAHSDNKVIEIDSVDQPGVYRVDWPDAAFVAGLRGVILTVKVATAFTEHLRVEIDGEVTAEALGTQAKADVQTEADTALASYNGPTSAELVSEIDDVQTDIAAIKTETALIVADTNELQVDDVPGLISALNNLSAANVATELATYDGPTRAEATSDKDEIVTLLSTEIADILTDTGTTIPALIAALNNITAASVLAAGDADGFTLEEALKLLLAQLSKLSGAATNTNTFRAADDSKDRITATVDENGNRSAVTFDATG